MEQDHRDQQKIVTKRKIKIIVVTATITFVALLAILRIPYLVNSWLLNSLGSNDSSIASSWISFWGSFLGGIVGMIAVVLTTYFLINNQNKHHNEQLEQQREDIVKSINSAVHLEREKFMIQFNIDKYEKALLLMLKLDSKVEAHKLKYNDISAFVSKYISFVIDSTKFIPDEEYKIHVDSIVEVENEIRGILQELSTLEKIIKPFDYKLIDNVIYQYLIEVLISTTLLNSDKRKEYFVGERLDDLYSKTMDAIIKCKETVHSCIEQELLKYRPIEEKVKSENEN